MAANYNRRRYASYKRRSHGDYYVDGNVVRKYDVVREIEKKPAKRLSEQTRKNRERATHMSLGYVAFLCVSMCVAAIILYNIWHCRQQIHPLSQQFPRWKAS